MFKNLKIRTKLLLGLGLIVILAFVAGFVGITTSKKIQDTAVLSSNISALLLEFSKLQQLTATVLTVDTPDEVKELRDRFRASEKTEGELDESIESSPFFPQIKDAFERLESEEKVFEEEARKVFDLHEEILNNLIVFSDIYSAEKQQRYDIREPLFKLDDSEITKNVGFMQYYSKETLYQHKDQKHLDEWLGSITNIRNSVTNPTIRADLDAYYKTAETMGAIAIQNKELEQRQDEAFEKLTAAVVRMQTNASSLEGAEESILQTIGDINAQANAILYGVMIITLILALLVSLFLSARISNSVARVRDVAIEIARGNMDVEIDISGKDEIAELSRAIDKMRESLKVVMEGYEKKVK